MPFSQQTVRFLPHPPPPNPLPSNKPSLTIIDQNLKALQRGCFRYFQLGRASEPVGLLGGLIKQPFVLFRHFFTVAFLSLWLVLKDAPLYALPLTIFQCAMVFWTACVVIFPYMVIETWS